MPAPRRRPFAQGDRQQTHADTTALAGPDGAELARLIRQSVIRGSITLLGIARDAVERAVDAGGLEDSLFTDDERQRLADTLAAVNASADLMGRARVWEQTDRKGAEPFASVKRFADDPGVVIATPEAALDYFSGLVPSLSVDAARFGETQRRRAFTLAASTEDVLTARVQDAITEALKEHKSTAEAQQAIDDVLNSAGVGRGRNDYATMVFRTNANDSYQQAYYEEARSPELRGEFPVWRYIGIKDTRTGKDHLPKIGRYYPAEAAFADVRGPRPFNCRCSMEWIDSNEWDQLTADGARVEANW